MGKMKEYYFDQLEAMADAPIEGECYCHAGPINSIEELCPECRAEFEEWMAEDMLPNNVINMMATELNHLDGDEFYSKLNEIEEYYEDNYIKKAA